jgi:DNA repair exonuclease SbcCD nuclease subunit
MSFLIVGDLHLRNDGNTHKTATGSNSKLEDQAALLNWVMNKAVEFNCKDIITTGDVFEFPKPHFSVIEAYVSWIARCKDAGIHVHTIMGNHDMLRSGDQYASALDILDAAKISNSTVYRNITTIKLGKTNITMMPFKDRTSLNLNSNAEALSYLEAELLEHSKSKKGKRVLIGHMAIEGSLYVGDEIDDLANEIFLTKESLKSFDYTWMGHIHNYQILHKKPHISHIGSLDLSNFGETDKSKFVVVYDEDLDSFSEHEIPTRPLVKLTIVIPTDVKDTTKYVLDEIAKRSNLDRSIVRLDISLASQEMSSTNRAEIESNLYNSGVFSIAGFSESKKVALTKKSDKITKIDANMDVPSSIKAFADSKFEDVELKTKFIELSLEIYNEHLSGDKH